MSLQLSPAVQNGAKFSLVIYKAAGGSEAEDYLVVIVNIIRLKPSDIYRKNGLIRGVQELFEYCSLTFASTGINLPMLDGHQEGYPPDDDYYLWHSTRRLFRRYPKPSHHERFVHGVSKKVP